MIIKESVIISKKNKKEFEFGYSLLRALILKIGGKSEPFRSSLNKKKLSSSASLRRAVGSRPSYNSATRTEVE